MNDLKLSGAWLWPPQDHIDDLVRANTCDNPVEAVMRIRALIEISRHSTTAELAALAALRQPVSSADEPDEIPAEGEPID